MELLLVGLFVLGIFLFLLSYLLVVKEAFQHQFGTGLIALFPVLNVLILPTIFHRNKFVIFTGFFGFLLFVVTWFFGANTLMSQQLNTWKTGKISITQTIDATEKTTQTIQKKEIETTVIPSGIPMPTKPLYHLSFEKIAIAKVAELTGKWVRITTKDNKRLEGKINTVSNDKNNVISLQEKIENEDNLQTIKKDQIQLLEVFVKK